MRYVLFLLVAGALVLSACGAGTPAANSATVGSIQVSDIWARAASAMGGMGEAQPTSTAMGEMQPTSTAMGEAGGANGAAYMMIRNDSTAPDRLVKATSDVAQTVELHTVVKEGDVMKMQPVEAIDVPASGETALKPGGFHVMLIGLKRDLKPGETVALTLQFEQAGTLNVQAEVRQ